MAEPNYKTDPVYCAGVEMIKAVIAEHGKDSREYWAVQALLTDLRPECSMQDPKSPLEPTEDGITQRYG